MQSIEHMSNRELAAEYNALTGASVTRFSSAAAGRERIRRAIEEQRRRRAVGDGPSRADGTTPRAREATPTVNIAPKGTARAPRPGTKRAAMVEKLQEGATAQEVGEVWGGRVDAQRVAQEVRWCARELGIGVETRGGRWWLVG